MRYPTTLGALVACMFAIAVASMPAGAFIDCSQQSKQTRPIALGVSGGNIRAFGKIRRQRVCFTGTLGSMVQDTNGKQFILSNNHVLADINKAKPGDFIVQPGLADIRCQKISSDAVATFSRTVKVKFGKKASNTIDAAIAAVKTGDVNADILNIGPIASSVVAATPGLAVQKMGRTSCLTSGMITAVGVNLGVTYNGKKSAMFVNQIEIDGLNFGEPGDSGSLIVTRDICPQAVALLFAGSVDQTMTFANPISDVLSGLSVSMTGGCTAAAAAEPEAVVEAGNASISKDAVNSAKAVRDRHEDQLMSIPGAVGTGIGFSDQPGQPAIEVYLKKLTPEAQAAAPKDVEGIPVKLIENGGVVAY
jgi:hypothetical protein